MSPDQLWPLLQVILVDLMLAADNAIVIGLAAASVPAAMRPRVIMLGIAAAAILRILFALVTVQLLQIVGLVLAGGLLLLWVCWKLWRELRSRNESPVSADGESVALIAGPVLFAALEEQSLVATRRVRIARVVDDIPAAGVEEDNVVVRGPFVFDEAEVGTIPEDAIAGRRVAVLV